MFYRTSSPFGAEAKKHVFTFGAQNIKQTLTQTKSLLELRARHIDGVISFYLPLDSCKVPALSLDRSGTAQKPLEAIVERT